MKLTYVLIVAMLVLVVCRADCFGRGGLCTWFDPSVCCSGICTFVDCW
uniref:Conotoxin Cal6.18 n=1 Tax=Californiconus californicus TaxID=1736779 RepID=O1618_CONCL|nr:RecName: Full=Conotoxin Cal6.18; AltName: Full=O1_cal6.18; Flags: Precursor [Californiconus californicus]